MHDRVGVFVSEIMSLAARQLDARRVVGHALERLTVLTPARVSALSVLRVEPPESPGVKPKLSFLDVIEGGSWPADARQSYMTYLNDEAAGDPFLEALFRSAVTTPGVVVSLTRRATIADDVWYNSRHYVKYRGAVGFDDCVYTAIFTGQGEASGLPAGLFAGIGLHALRGSREFTSADCDLARAAVFATLPLLAVSLETERAGAANLFASLTPRQRDVLVHLNEGLSAKQIAHQLKLTPTSVQTYIQALCKRLGVRGQREAVALCNKRGWLVQGRKGS